MARDNRHQFTKSELEQILNACIDKRLQDVDVQHVLERNGRNKGNPGAVIEQSVLGYPADNARRPDLEVDGVETELKTTGIVESKKDGIPFEAKEPVSVTAVSPEKIISEDFETSSFWEKTAHMLFVYYEYAHRASTPAEYADFPIKNYQFVDFSGEDRARLEKDWTIVRDFIRDIHQRYPDDPQSQYPRISSDLNRQRLTVIDTAPKWPNRPRFRLKRKFVSTLVNQRFGMQYDILPREYTGFEDLDFECHQLTQQYAGKTVFELFDEFGIPRKAEASKRDAERIVVAMFGGKAKKMSRVETFAKFSVVGKTIVLTANGGRTEDTKFDAIDFDELQNPNMTFEESSFRANFYESQILCSVFEEPSSGAAFGENVFKGFKRFCFDEEFVDIEVRGTWNEARRLIFDHALRIVPDVRKDGKVIRNRNGEVRSAPNWPKSSERTVFFRGSGDNSDPRYKTVCVNGLRMYRQNVWVKGSYMAEKMSQLPFL
ncbi:MutH family type II restriction endonuclease [Bifidobacterium lemurum]|uniref:MutH family type II restriction endonuclease n=1 Tax=Bifidobacterium lemurum TaxID=1603886 RepID=A0A261FR83_9BIFI|nr:MutH/Sau3AI family endonuclease [Bifidobacterium lemurum]OZG61495.1 MutH family type II restriction endonuclease [Bifidobacterium lemurum]QOL35084.1 restriction endonuclease [Bifidobacterium lemurum]